MPCFLCSATTFFIVSALVFAPFVIFSAPSFTPFDTNTRPSFVPLEIFSSTSLSFACFSTSAIVPLIKSPTFFNLSLNGFPITIILLSCQNNVGSAPYHVCTSFSVVTFSIHAIPNTYFVVLVSFITIYKTPSSIYSLS